MSDSKYTLNTIYVLIDIIFYIVLFLKTIVKFNKLYPVFQTEDFTWKKEKDKKQTFDTLPLGYHIL